jgi:hypothetical protein
MSRRAKQIISTGRLKAQGSVKQNLLPPEVVEEECVVFGRLKAKKWAEGNLSVTQPVVENERIIIGRLKAKEWAENNLHSTPPVARKVCIITARLKAKEWANQNLLSLTPLVIEKGRTTTGIINQMMLGITYFLRAIMNAILLFLAITTGLFLLFVLFSSAD